MMARLKELEGKNRRLKKVHTDERLKAEIVQESAPKKVVKPSRLKEVAQESVTNKGVSIRLICIQYPLSITDYLERMPWRPRNVQ